MSDTQWPNIPLVDLREKGGMEKRWEKRKREGRDGERTDPKANILATSCLAA